MVEIYAKNKELQRMTQDMKDNIVKGWTLGVENQHKHKLNSQSYPEDWLGREAALEGVLQLTEEMIAGKVIPIKN